MGIYNIVNFELTCPVCNALIRKFQTKEGNGVFDIIPFQEVDNFYAICSHCQSLVEFWYSPEKKERTIQDYKMKVIQLGK